MSCAVIRRRSPDLRTLPSMTYATPSCFAISEIGTGRPLKEKADVRDETFRPGTLARTLSSSSLMPSEKYSFALSSLRFANASTATDLASTGALLAAGRTALGDAGDAAGAKDLRHGCQIASATPVSTSAAAIAHRIDSDLLRATLTGSADSHGITTRCTCIGNSMFFRPVSPRLAKRTS